MTAWGSTVVGIGFFLVACSGIQSSEDGGEIPAEVVLSGVRLTVQTDGRWCMAPD